MVVTCGFFAQCMLPPQNPLKKHEGAGKWKGGGGGVREFKTDEFTSHIYLVKVNNHHHFVDLFLMSTTFRCVAKLTRLADKSLNFGIQLSIYLTPVLTRCVKTERKINPPATYIVVKGDQRLFID